MKKRIFVIALTVLLCAGLVAGAVALEETAIGGQAKSYREIYRLLKSRQRYGLTMGAAPREAGAGVPEMGAVADTAAYSKTNVQEAGVDEADIVKTDGKHIYALSPDRVQVFLARGEKLEKLAEISGEGFEDLYLRGDRLAVICRVYSDSAQKEAPAGEETEMVACMAPQGATGVMLYDVGNPESPKQAGEYRQDGSLVSSRMVGDSLYLVTAKTPYETPELARPETFIPMLWENGRGSLIPAGDISVSPDISREECPENYLLVGGLNALGDGRKTSVKALLGYGRLVYASAQNLYVAAPADLSQEGRHVSGTQLLRFSLDGGQVRLAAQGQVEGTVDDQFSMDEEGAYFRVLTTVDSRAAIGEDGKYAQGREPTVSNSLHVLSTDLKPVGRLSDLAPGERIYSARFMGDTAYFVTFRNVDPLFAADLSNPQAPKILSALKIPGFSEYLHPFGEGLLLGIGRDADEETGETGQVKLSMFDISDPKAVFETQKTLTKEGYSEALYNHKAVLADADRKLVAFPGEDNYLIYAYDEKKGFKLKKAIQFDAGENSAFGNIRGLYIGDYLYAVGYGGIAAVDMKTFEIVNTLYY